MKIPFASIKWVNQVVAIGANTIYLQTNLLPFSLPSIRMECLY